MSEIAPNRIDVLLPQEMAEKAERLGVEKTRLDVVKLLLLGVIEGLAGAGMSIAKIIAGPISDWLGRRKPLLLLGYGMSALVKLIFPLAITR